MSVNPKLPPNQKKLAYLSQITTALQNIASALSYEMGPFKRQKMSSLGEEVAKQAKEIDEINRRETEIEELKKANKLLSTTARIAVIGLVITALFSGFQLLVSYLEYQRPPQSSEIKMQVSTDGNEQK